MNEFGRVSANRRLTLLAEADRLTGELKKKAPPNQLAVLGASFAEIYDYDKAEKYFRMMTDEKNPVSLRVSGLKSIALVEFQKGLASYATSRESFRKASALLGNLTDVGSIGMAIEVDQEWAALEEAAGDPDVAMERLLDAKSVALKIPCPAGRSVQVGQVDTLIQTLSAAPRPSGKPARADIAAALANFKPGDNCAR